jgi:phosphatidylglycerophosphate synthase
MICNLIALFLCIHYVQPEVFDGQMTLPDGSVANWLFLLVAFLLLTYQALDNIDGKQARR